MVEVEMTKDIRDYEPKLFGLVTTRQIIVLSIGIAYAAPIALLIPTDFANQCMIAVFLMLPMILIGWVSVYGNFCDPGSTFHASFPSAKKV